jgi:hypothetical protein
MTRLGAFINEYERKMPGRHGSTKVVLIAKLDIIQGNTRAQHASDAAGHHRSPKLHNLQMRPADGTDQFFRAEA